ncbi:MAG: PqqD family protein, partial [Myxococcota bacterium]|nr:PqqD family protein [Myxococcota bacterium]
MSEDERQRFDPQVRLRDRDLPAWVTPRIERRDSQGAALSLGLAPEQTTSLNSSARAIRELCDRRRSLFEIVAALRERYVSDDTELCVDVSSALLKLQSLGLVERPADGPGARPPVRFAMGIEDKTYFHWQLPILFESLIGQLPEDWKIFVVVCNDHQPLSEALLHVLQTYGVRYFTATSHPANENIDFAGGGDVYVPFNRIEALRVVAPHVRKDDVVFLLDTDNFLYRELDPSVFPRENALCENDIIAC